MFNGTAEPQIFWGARTIFNTYYDHKAKRNRNFVDAVPDRCGHDGVMVRAARGNWGALIQTPEFIHFADWVTETATPKMDAWLETQHGRSRDVFELHEEINGAKYHYRASCNASCGHCYIAAWRE